MSSLYKISFSSLHISSHNVPKKSWHLSSVICDSNILSPVLTASIFSFLLLNPLKILSAASYNSSCFLFLLDIDSFIASIMTWYILVSMFCSEHSLFSSARLILLFNISPQSLTTFETSPLIIILPSINISISPLLSNVYWLYLLYYIFNYSPSIYKKRSWIFSSSLYITLSPY